jgi:hypothetical protein
MHTTYSLLMKLMERGGDLLQQIGLSYPYGYGNGEVPAKSANKGAKSRMSYCRKNAESDVYLYPSSYSIVCCGCLFLSAKQDDIFGTEREAIDHLRMHIQAGHKVPQSAIDRLKEEMNR